MMRTFFPKRILSFLLVIALLLGFFPAFSVPASAASSSGSLSYKTSPSGDWYGVSSGTDLFDLARLSTAGTFLWIHNTSSSASAEYVIGYGQYGIRGTLVLTSAGGNFRVRSGESGTTVQMKGNGTIYVGSNVTLGVESATSIWCGEEAVAPTIWVAGILPVDGITATDAENDGRGVKIHNIGGSYTVVNGSPSTTNYHKLTLVTDANCTASASGYASAPFTYESNYYYSTNSIAKITGHPNTGYHITSGTESVTMYEDRQVNVTSAVNTHTVYFNSNGGSGTMSPQTITYGSTNYLTQNTMTRTGYTFDGWRTSPSGGTSYANRADVTALAETHGGSTTLYARWTPNNYTVTYNANKPANATGTVAGTMTNSPHTYDTAKNLNTNGYSLTGWTFKGWSRTASGTAEFQDGGSVRNLTASVNGVVTLYAVWEAKQYTVTLDAQGGKGGTTTTVTYDSAYGMGLTAPERQGYNFVGYFTGTGESGTQYFNAAMVPTKAKWDITAATKLYAHWVPLEYNIEYYSEGKYAGEQTKIKYGAFKLLSDAALAISKQNYTFVGWNIFTDQNWAMYQAAQDYSGGLSDKDGDTVVLHAAWQENEKFTFTYNANGGRGEPPAEQVYINNDYTISADSPTQENHDFLGWSTNPLATTATYEPGDLFENMTENVTLYAVWRQHPKVSFHANGGQFAAVVNAVYAAKNTAVYPTTIAVTREGYTLAGWTTDEEGRGQVYSSAAPYTMGEEDVTLYAKWEIAKYTVTVSTSADCTVDITSGEEFNYNSVVSFQVTSGENVRVYINGLQYSPDNEGKYSFTITADTTIMAVAVSTGQYLLSYDPNGGFNAPVDVNLYTSGQSAAVKAGGPVRTGYTFGGWATTKTATTSDVGVSITVTEDVTLYAVWTPISYSIRFNAAGGSGSMTAQSIDYDEATVLTSNNFSRDGYQFKGWALTSGGDIAFKDGAQVKNLADKPETIDLYAVWGRRVTTVHFDANGGSLTGALYTSVEYGKTLTDSLTAPTRQGYTFGGYVWDTGVSKLSIYGADMKPNEAYDSWSFNKSEITVTAQWTPINYSIKLNDGAKELNYPYFTSISYDAAITLPGSVTLAADYGMSIADGKYFAGWTNTPGSSAIYYTDGQQITTGLTGTAGVTVYLYAVYKDIERYTVRYDANGGTGLPSDSGSYIPGTTVSVKFDVSPVRDGYSFTGWATSSTAAKATYTESGTGSFTMGDDFVTLYAVWTPNAYTVTYNANQGSGTVSDSSFTYGVTGTLSNGAGFQKTGHELIGWATSANGAVTYALGSSVWNLSNQQGAEITLYAVWQAKSYTVTFKSGAETVATTTVSYGSAYGALPDGPAKAGHSFSGWYTQASGGDKITALSLHEIDGGVTLHAQWTPGSFLIVFDGNGGSVSPASKEVVYGEAYGTLPTPTRGGYVFDGWFTDAAAGTEMTATATVAITGTTTLYAHWVKDSYTVTIPDVTYATLSAGGTVRYGEDFTFTVTVGAHVNTSGMTVTANGITLTPVSVDAYVYTYKIMNVAADQTVAVTGLALNIYTITYMVDGAQHTTAMALAGDKLTAPNPPAKPGFAFTGWFAAGGTEWNFASDTVSGSMTLTARWSDSAYTLKTLIVNGCATIDSITPDKTSYAHGDEISFTATPTDGYLDVGVFAYANGIKINGSSFIMTADTTLAVAPTNAATYPVTLEANGGTIQSGQANVYTQGVGLVLPTELTRTGHSFAGWYASSSFSGAPVTEILPSETEARTFYAKWEPNRYLVSTLTSEMGTIRVIDPSADERYSYGSTITITVTPAEGYAISGILLMANTSPLTATGGTGGGASYSFLVTSDTTLYLLPASSSGVTYSAIATGYSGVYDGKAHALTVMVVPANLTISSYQWHKNGAAISGGTGATHAVKNVADSGSYYCVITGVDQQNSMRMVTSNTVTVSITPDEKGEGGAAIGGGGGAATAPPAGGTALVIVDGVEYDIGTATVSGRETTVTVDQTQLQAKIADSKNGAMVEVIVPAETEAASAQMVMRNFSDMAAKNMSLVAYLGDVMLEIPAGEIYIDAIADSLGVSSLENIAVTVTASKAGASETEQARQSVLAAGATLVGTPVSFTMTASYEGKTYDVTRFSGFTTRRVSLTEAEAQKAVTGAVLENGSLRHVPTSLYRSGGQWFADMHTMTNSLYVLLSYEKRFADAAGTWYEAEVCEMASRRIITGVSDTSFDGGRGITRAEFAAITVRALGLPETAGRAFDDVPLDAWYCGAVNTAHGYGLIQGRGGRQFDPDAFISRQEAMVLTQRAAQLAGYVGKSSSIEGFSDSGDVALWAQDAARFHVGSGLIQGNDGLLNPTERITRAETAVLLLRLLQKAELVDTRG